jgi:hypothetical protein
MTEFDDLNKALADLQLQMKKAANAAELIAQLALIADVLKTVASAVDAKLRTCQQGVTSLAATIKAAEQQVTTVAVTTTQHWQDAGQQFLQRSSESCGVLSATIQEQLRACVLGIAEAGKSVEELHANVSVVAARVSSQMQESGEQFLQRSNQSCATLVAAVESRLNTCEVNVVSLEKAIGAFQDRLATAVALTTRQWEEASDRVAERSGQSCTTLAAAVEFRLKICEANVVSLEKAIAVFQDKLATAVALTTRQWEEATARVAEKAGQSHLEAVRGAMQQAATEYLAGIATLKAEFACHDVALGTAQRWNRRLVVFVLALTTIVGTLAGLVLRPYLVR